MTGRNPSSGSHARILLVDDNQHGLKARKTVLEELGHDVTPASSAAEALERLAEQPHDLVVTDFRMPHMDGVELIRRVRERAPAVPIILVSGYVDAMGLSEANSGADLVIQKSANEVSHLVRAVSRLLRKKPVRAPGTAKASRQAG